MPRSVGLSGRNVAACAAGMSSAPDAPGSWVQGTPRISVKITSDLFNSGKKYFGDFQANPCIVHVQKPFFPAALRAAE